MVQWSCQLIHSVYRIYKGDIIHTWNFDSDLENTKNANAANLFEIH